MVSDFFCPNTGGVETHIYYLSQCLIQMGHKVLVISHAYSNRKGICWLSNGLKVYYLPFLVFYNGCILPTVYTTLPWIREILIKEKVDVLHGHSSFSCLAHESMFHAQAMGVCTLFTDHSLFGFADASSIITNKLLQFTLANVNHVICVSHTCKENTVLRARLASSRVSVIPNAIDTKCFTPDPDLFYSNPVTIVVVSRLVYRKGTDLLAQLIPILCSKYSDLRFLIAGDGPKRIQIEEIRDKLSLQDRVTMLGNIPHTQVRDVLVQGQIFLNTSLTEAFCMAIVEAACCGLHVVTTKVGGIPEVLPEDLTTFAQPNVNSLLSALEATISCVQSGSLCHPTEIHNRVRSMYYWPSVAARTERVYRNALKSKPLPAKLRLKRYFRCGFGFGLFFIAVTVINLLLLRILEIIRPPKSISPPCLFPSAANQKNNHSLI